MSSGDQRLLDSGVIRPSETSTSGSALAESFSVALPILRALVAGTPASDTLVVAVDARGFPVAQTVAKRPGDLPYALVIGRHNRCGLAIANDNRVSLRHLLLTIWPGQGGLLLRGYDLGGRAGVTLADGTRAAGFSAHGRVALSFGRTTLYALPGGPDGAALMQGGPQEVYQRLTGVDAQGGGQSLAVAAEPGVAELGGYRGADLSAREARGFFTASLHKERSRR